ncbi:hypothetical protein ACFXTH_010251 [Malus domestica]
MWLTFSSLQRSIFSIGRVRCVPFFFYHDLFSHVNGSSSAPDPKLPADTITWESDGPLYLYIPLCNYDGWRPGAITLFRG